MVSTSESRECLTPTDLDAAETVAHAPKNKTTVWKAFFMDDLRALKNVTLSN
jgi:hypothetical protein